ncbi:hypothetical protein [Chroococcidiopsis sp.]|uniref:hypothetical protein n=1 Tax=Chroococcidiopsis sp. TaxID=3088168 RepID=UPI003F2EEF21
MAEINPVVIEELQRMIILQNKERLDVLMRPSFMPHAHICNVLSHLLYQQLQQKALFYGHVFCDNLERSEIIQRQITKEKAEIPELLKMLMQQRSRLLKAGVC